MRLHTSTTSIQSSTMSTSSTRSEAVAHIWNITIQLTTPSNWTATLTSKSNWPNVRLPKWMRQTRSSKFFRPSTTRRIPIPSQSWRVTKPKRTIHRHLILRQITRLSLLTEYPFPMTMLPLNKTSMSLFLKISNIALTSIVSQINLSISIIWQSFLV